jgi:glutamate-ammonia-ligase adenylyltransferase
VHHLRGLIDAAAGGAHYADLADAVLGALWPAVVAEFAAKHGAPPGRGAAVLGMGSLGAARLNALSDLDLIVIYDAMGGRGLGWPPPARRAGLLRPAHAGAGHGADRADGRGAALRGRHAPAPLGRQGPVATSFAAFRSYQRDEAWTWEHLALTRAREVVTDRRTKALAPGTLAVLEDARRAPLGVVAVNPGSRSFARCSTATPRLQSTRLGSRPHRSGAGPARAALRGALLPADPCRGRRAARRGDRPLRRRLAVIQPNAAWAEALLDDLTAALREVTGVTHVLKNARRPGAGARRA